MKIIYTLFIILIFIIALPLFMIIGVSIFLFSGFPILFQQRRMGKSNHPFTLYKFRTMIPGADEVQDRYKKQNEADGPVFKIHDDPRFTPIGKFLSHTGLDELPQLWNVIRGNMALFGPRPLPLREAHQLLSWQKKRNVIKPGIISPWVLDGYHKHTFTEWMKSDCLYVQQKNVFYDLQLFGKAVDFMMMLLWKETLGKLDTIQ